MASCITSQWGNSYSPQVRLTVTQSSSTDTTVTLKWTAEWVAHGYAASIGSRDWTGKVGSTAIGGTFAANGLTGTKTMGSGTVTITKTTSAQTINFSISYPFNMSWSGVSTTTRSASGSISVAAKTSYTISYNANGGSGAPSAQTKWHGTDLTISSTKPTRTGYSFQGWALTASGSVYYTPGSTCGKNENLTLYAVWKANTYTVSYNANGGSGAPSSQTKTYGVTLTLSSTKPTRTNYNFLGWGTSASATTVSYAAGASYTANAGITLYAIWQLAYVKPRISNLSADRCLSDGTVNEEEGTYALVKFKWACDKSVSSIKVTWESDTGGSGSTTISASGTSGTVSTVIGSGAFSTESSYTLHVTVADSGGSFSKDTFLNGLIFPIDVHVGGDGVAFGKPAELSGYADFGFDARFTGNVIGNALGLGKLVSIPSNANFNDYFTTGCYAVTTNATSETITNIPVKKAGRLIVVDATGSGGDSSSSYAYRQQIYIPYTISSGIFIRDINQGSSGSYTYGGWYKITLTAV